MVQQRLQNRSLDGWRGIALVLGVVAAVVAGSWAFTQLGQRIGGTATLLFFAYGAAIAWALLRWVIMGFEYTASADCLSVQRAYGKRRRAVIDVYFSKVTAWGSREDVERRKGKAKVVAATLARSPYETLALWVERQDGAVMLLIQPDKDMREFLIKRLRERAG